MNLVLSNNFPNIIGFFLKGMLSLSPNTTIHGCIGCGDTDSSTVSSSGRSPQRFSRQFYDIVVILYFISGLSSARSKRDPNRHQL